MNSVLSAGIQMASVRRAIRRCGSLLATGLLLGGGLLGCSRAPEGATGPLPEVAAPERAGAVPLPYAGTSMGCATSGGSFFVLRFAQDGNKAEMETASGRVGATVQPAAGTGDFELSFGEQTLQFVEPPFGLTVRESHVLPFNGSNGRPAFLCFVHDDGAYVSDDDSMPWLEAMPGAWQCDGSLGRVTLESGGAFQFAGGAGRAVFSSPRRSAESMTLYVLRGVQPGGVAQSVESWPLAVRGDQMLLNGQRCQRSQ